MANVNITSTCGRRHPIARGRYFSRAMCLQQLPHAPLWKPGRPKMLMQRTTCELRITPEKLSQIQENVPLTVVIEIL